MFSKRFYLDFNATSPLASSVKDWLASGSFFESNSSSQHSSGKSAKRSLNQAREEIYKTFSKNEKEDDLYFHSGATEGIVSSAISFSLWAKKLNVNLHIFYAPTDHAAVTQLAHHPLLKDVRFHELSLKSDLTYDHEKNKELVKSQLGTQDLGLYFHLWVHNETGLISPLEKLLDIKNGHKLFIHVDAVQAVGKISDWKTIPFFVDMVTFSGHKFGGLKGIGFSFYSKKILFSPIITGGGQQKNFRSGTENTMGIESIRLALKEAHERDFHFLNSAQVELKKVLSHHLERLGGEILTFDGVASNTIYFYFDRMSSDISLAFFDLQGFEISAGSACSSGAAKKSIVLEKLGLGDKAKNGLRLSFNPKITSIELNDLITHLDDALKKLN